MNDTTPERILHRLVEALALWVALAQISMLLHLPWSTLALAYPSLLTLLALRTLRAPAAPTTPLDPGARLVLPLTACAVATLTLLSLRPEADDIKFGGTVVHYLAHPHQPLDFAQHHLGLLRAPLDYPYLLGAAIEHLWGVIAYWTGLPLLTVIHVVVPITAGVLLPLAWFAAIRAFGARPHHAALAALAIATFLAFDTATKRSLGNWSLYRIWQGKALLMGIWTPYVTSISLRFLDHPTPARFRRLLLAGALAAGLSGTAAAFAPLLTAFIGLGALVQHPRHLRRVLVYGLSATYPLCLGIWLKLRLRHNALEYMGFQIESFPSSFAGQWALVFGHGPSPTTLTLLLTLAIAARTTPHRRRLLLGWSLGAALLVFNPWSAPLVARKLTTWNTYWRMLYALPFPLTLGLTAAALARHTLPRPRTSLALTTLTITAAAFALPALHKHPFGLRPNKLPAIIVEANQRFAPRRAPGLILAPRFFSATMPLLHPDTPQVNIRDFFLNHFLILEGRPEDVQHRLRAVDYITNANPTLRDDFVDLLRHPELTNVILSPAADQPPAHTALHDAGFRLAYRDPQGLGALFTRPTP